MDKIITKYKVGDKVSYPTNFGLVNGTVVAIRFDKEENQHVYTIIKPIEILEDYVKPARYEE